MRGIHIIAFAVSMAVPLSSAIAEETAEVQAKQLAKTLCFSCHGAEGVSPVDLYPNLRNQKATYLEKQLKEFRDGKRVDPVMNGMAASLTDPIIQALAKHYSSGAKP